MIVINNKYEYSFMYIDTVSVEITSEQEENGCKSRTVTTAVNREQISIRGHWETGKAGEAR